MKALLPDELWAKIEPLLPRPKRRRFRHPGRKPLDRRKVLTGILFVLRTGIPWRWLPARRPYSQSSHLMNSGNGRPRRSATPRGIRHIHQAL